MYSFERVRLHAVLALIRRQTRSTTQSPGYLPPQRRELWRLPGNTLAHKIPCIKSTPAMKRSTVGGRVTATQFRSRVTPSSGRICSASCPSPHHGYPVPTRAERFANRIIYSKKSSKSIDDQCFCAFLKERYIQYKKAVLSQR